MTICRAKAVTGWPLGLGTVVTCGTVVVWLVQQNPYLAIKLVS
jgi:hypothetical protein